MPTIVAICPTCSEVRYRSVKDIAAGSKATAADFALVDPQMTPPSDGQPALCDTCGATLKFAPETVTTVAPDTILTRDELRRRMVSQRMPVPANGNPTVTTLFQVSANEAIKDMRELAGGVLLIVTTHRVVTITT